MLAPSVLFRSWLKPSEMLAPSILFRSWLKSSESSPRFPVEESAEVERKARRGQSHRTMAGHDSMAPEGSSLKSPDEPTTSTTSNHHLLTHGEFGKESTLPHWAFSLGQCVTSRKSTQVSRLVSDGHVSPPGDYELCTAVSLFCLNRLIAEASCSATAGWYFSTQANLRAGVNPTNGDWFIRGWTSCESKSFWQVF
jgi:hypothetical protein